VKETREGNQNDLTTPAGSHEAAENVVGRILQKSLIPFKKLCNPEHKGDSKPIELFDAETGKTIEVKWKVCCSERAFDNLFLAYWRGIREQWKKEFSLDRERYDKLRIEAELADVCSQIRSRENALHGPGRDERKLKNELRDLGEKRMDLEQRKSLVDRVNDDKAWEKYGQSVLASWKRDGVPPNTFLALASGYFDFKRGVKFITGENRLDRALPWFRRFLRSRVADENMAERAMAESGEKAFTSVGKCYSLKDEFAKWKRPEKSRLAQESRKARGKRGRVRSERDKRLGAR
jgi:hypothetical protein